MRACTTLDVAVLVFARAPVAGRAKTRLAPRLGAEGAARLQLRLIAQAERVAHAARCGPVSLYLAARHARFRGARLQRGADLGERMERALRGALRRHRAAILIGADCPALEAAHLRRAARLLAAGYDAVLAPAEDGGYVLVGLRRALPGLFSGIAWGGAGVYAASAAKLAASGRRWRALERLWDVDRPEDLERLKGLRSFSMPRRGARR